MAKMPNPLIDLDKEFADNADAIGEIMSHGKKDKALSFMMSDFSAYVSGILLAESLSRTENPIAAGDMIFSAWKERILDRIKQDEKELKAMIEEGGPKSEVFKRMLPNFEETVAETREAVDHITTKVRSDVLRAAESMKRDHDKKRKEQS
jgi:hypothetical protein